MSKVAWYLGIHRYVNSIRKMEVSRFRGDWTGGIFILVVDWETLQCRCLIKLLALWVETLLNTLDGQTYIQMKEN